MLHFERTILDFQNNFVFYKNYFIFCKKKKHSFLSLITKNQVISNIGMANQTVRGNEL